MAGLSFLSKKSWHVSNISNQEKVWLAEQKAASEAQKTKELQEQIKAEREREEFDKLANKKSVGDRGTNWMYEGHGVAGEDAGKNNGGAKSEAAQAVEDAKNEAYLLGKEYVPEGQAKNSGDFAVASAMTGALEKASTYGATIGVGTNNNIEGESTLRIQDGTTTTVSSGLVDDHNTEWNQEFHLRHEDPMFAVQQKQKQKLKDVEKKKRLMERAGLEVRPMIKGDDRNYDGKEKKLREGDHEGRGEGEESHKRHHHHKKKKKRKHHSKSSRKSKKSRKYKKRRHRDSRSPSYSSESYSSSSSVSSRGRDGDRYHHRGKHDGRKHHRHHSEGRGRGEDDDYSSSRHCYRRSRSIDRNCTRKDRYDDNDHSRRRSSGGRSNRHHRYRHGSRSRSYSSRRSPSYSRSRSRDEKKQSSSMREHGNGGDNLSNNDDRKNNKRHHDDKYDRNHDNNHDKNEQGGNASTKKKIPGYGLIGTSLTDRNNNNSSTTKQQQKHHDYLGPNQKLLQAKRDEIERERQSRLEEAGRGGGRNGGGDGYSREERLKEMERTAKDRLR